MEIVVVLIAGIVLGIPVMAIVALVRSGKVRDLLEESNSEHRREISVLRSEVAQLRRELVEASQQVRERPPTAVPSPAASAGQTRPVTTPAVTLAAAQTAKVEEKTASSVSSAPVIDWGAVVAPPTVAPPKQAPPPPVVVQAASKESPAKPEVAAPSQLEPVLRSESRATAASASVVAPVAGRDKPPAYAQPTLSSPAESPVTSFADAPQRKRLAERLRATLPLEEVLGMNLFAKIGIVLLVLGFALLGRMALISMGPGERVGLIYAVSAALLGGGIWLEAKERYRIIGRGGIGGGWALLFFTTYAMNHVPAMAVLDSNTADCVLMLLVAMSMVAHTLRYKSQVVTGLAFLLAFSTVAISQDSVYALAAGVILALGIVAIALRMQWYELEVFGILASYANHFYWLYKLYPDGFSGHVFPQFWPSVTILVLYWAVFRISYVARTIRNFRDESISTIAALLNPVLLLSVMKFQSTRPELAFYALLGLGAVEFFSGQLPPSRRRRVAFKLLTVVGTILMFASVPFKFSGNNIALFWMIAAEFLLIAGIIQPEVVFRRLGLIAGTVTGLLIVYEARSILEFRQHSEAPLFQDGVLLLTSTLLFCANAQFIRRKWDRFFDNIDAPLASVQSYLGAITAFFGVWAIFTTDWTALGWVALFLGAAAGKRYLNDNHLMIQAWALAAAVLVRCEEVNCHFDVQYPHHVAARLITLPILALAFYLAGWVLSGVKDMRVHLRLLALWAGSLLFAVLAWLDVSQAWVAPVWVGFAVLLVLIARRIRVPEFSYQEHVLAVAAVAQLAAFNLGAATVIDRYLPVIGCAVAFYAISRFCT